MIAAIATADAEAQEMAVKLAGTLSLFRVITMKPHSGMNLRLTMMHASSKLSYQNRINFHSKPLPADKKRPIPVARRAQRRSPMMYQSLRGLDPIES